ncbi:hypothetical protein [Cecembia rubra]|uniref:Uncharacterized protein n=1 Tax=Cecembia rubra TaxID=1485585 RepID=A0A2P8EAS9_9BACT|nr:hypothetical protein [Cecembia rubra]PSL06568.1 hypothetical protein CLV48_102385 [Cecembia rubra]
MKTLSPKSHIGKVRKASKDQKQEIQDLLMWSDDAYCRFQFREYCHFVETLTTGWLKVREQILYSPVFRGFWNNEWNARDREFLEFTDSFSKYPLDQQERVYCMTEYMLLHSHKALLEDDEFMMRYYQILKLL